MRALFLRFSQFTGPVGLLTVLLGVTVAPWLIVTSGHASLGPVRMAGWAIVAIATAIVVVRNTHGHRKPSIMRIFCSRSCNLSASTALSSDLSGRTERSLYQRSITKAEDQDKT